MRQIGLGDLSHLIGTLLRDPLLGDLWVAAEVSACSASPAGHWYMTLKEGDVTMRANCWKGVNQRLKRPTVGAMVQVHGRVDFYGARGEVQFIVDDIRDVGIGLAQAELERLMTQYASMAKHRPIPAVPQRIGIVTSRTGAAYQDVLTTLTQRYPCIELVLAHSTVQGVDAPTSIEAALEALYGEPLDVILVVRGGGASEDLAAFNSEIVARAMLRSPIPIISGVGHETDTTLADMVADVRAATPTAAAVKATPSRAELTQHLANLRYTLDYHIANRCTEADMRLDDYAARLRRAAPAQRIASYQQNLNYVNQRLQQAMHQRLTALQAQVERGSDRLTALDPQAVLSRGYAIVRDSAGSIMRSRQSSHPQQAIHIQFADGQIDATVTTTQ